MNIRSKLNAPGSALSPRAQPDTRRWDPGPCARGMRVSVRGILYWPMELAWLARGGGRERSVKWANPHVEVGGRSVPDPSRRRSSCGWRAAALEQSPRPSPMWTQARQRARACTGCRAGRRRLPWRAAGAGAPCRGASRLVRGRESRSLWNCARLAAPRLRVSGPGAGRARPGWRESAVEKALFRINWSPASMFGPRPGLRGPACVSTSRCTTGAMPASDADGAFDSFTATMNPRGRAPVDNATCAGGAVVSE